MPLPQRKTAPAAKGVSLLDLASYSGDFVLPEGDYAIYHDIRIHRYTKQDGSQGLDMLGVMLTCYPLAGGEPTEQFLGLGKKAITSFAPDPNSPAWNEVGSTKLVAIPGAPAGNMSGQTNFNLWIKSLVDCGLPQDGTVDLADISSLDGILVHTAKVQEPGSRKALGAATGEVGQQKADRGPQMIPVVTEIKDDGKPWEGSGGLPEGAGEPAAAPAPKVAPKVPAKPTPKAPVAPAKPGPKKPGPKAPPVEEEAAEGGDEDVLAVATAAITTVLEANPAGCALLKLRTGAFNAAKASNDEDMAQRVIDEVVEDGDTLNGILGDLGYKLNTKLKKIEAA